MTADLPTDVAVGLHGLRTFRIREDGYLLPVVFSIEDSAAVPPSWGRGFCVATCLTNSLCPDGHEPPVAECGCGIYSWNTLARLHRNYPENTEHIVAVVALEGQTIEGTRGFRSQAARIVALWLNEQLVPPHVRRAVRRAYPDVALHRKRSTMIRRYLSSEAAVAPEASTRLARTPRRVRHAGPPAEPRQTTRRPGLSERCRRVARALWWLVPAVALVLLIGVLRDDTDRLIAGLIATLGLSVLPLLLGVDQSPPVRRDSERPKRISAPTSLPARAAAPRTRELGLGQPVLVAAPAHRMS